MPAPLTLQRTDSSDPALPDLIRGLDELLVSIYGERMEFYRQFNGLEDIAHVLIARLGEDPVGTVSLKVRSAGTLEIKRMFTHERARGVGIGQALLDAADTWALELGADRLILETGDELAAATRLYLRHGFTRIPNYPPYVGNAESRCYAKVLPG